MDAGANRLFNSYFMKTQRLYISKNSDVFGAHDGNPEGKSHSFDTEKGSVTGGRDNGFKQGSIQEIKKGAAGSSPTAPCASFLLPQQI